MQNSKFGFNVLSVIIIFSLVITGFLYIDFKEILGKTACLTVATIMPDGLLSKRVEGQKFTEIFINNESVSIQNNKTNSDSDNYVTTAVPETIIGNVIKKTMSPYSANTSSADVYLNNQSGASIDIISEIGKDLSYKVTKGDKPQILIYHTHTTEAFMNSEEEYYTNADEPRTTDEDKNIIAVGEMIAQQLEKAGYTVIHEKVVHDYPGFSGSYSRSANTVKSALEKYPDIKIAIDVHRDSIASGENDKVAPVVNVNGKDAAQVMLVMGSETGSVKDYPYWRDNLRLAMKLQQVFEQNYPQFARALLLRSTKYNQELTKGSFLIEMGSDANTLEQALYSGELVGKSLVKLLEEQK